MRPALVSGPQNRKKPYNKHLISLVFSVRTVNYGSSFFFFFLSIYGPRASRLGRKSMEKISVRNLQYGPKTRLIRGIYLFIHIQKTVREKVYVKVFFFSIKNGVKVKGLDLGVEPPSTLGYCFRSVGHFSLPFQCFDVRARSKR